ncbi:methyltransferase domain-containing protein [Planctomycetaceae bacterium SH139]
MWHGGQLKEPCSRFQRQNQTVIPSGIEVSINSAKVAQEVVSPLGGQVIQASAIAGVSALEPKSLDVMVMSSFLEHESQPLLLLQRLRDALTDQAIIVLKVPNFACVNRVLRGNKWCGFRFPDHTNYFTPATLRCLAAEAGFVCRQSFLDKLPSSDTMYAVLKKTGSAMAN